MRSQVPWNRLRPEEEGVILAAARGRPTWRSRQLAAWITDQQGMALSESMGYRLLRREGQVKRPELRLLAGKEYRRKTSAPH